MTCAERLIEVRKKNGYTRKMLADELGIPYKTISNYETGEREPGHSYIIKVAQKFGVTTDYILGMDSTDGLTKNAPSDLSEEARKIARSYDRMNDHGKGAVRAILHYEEKELSHYTQQEDNTGKVITLPKAKKNRQGFIEINVYDEPAAAGLGNYLDDPEYRVEQYPEDIIPPKTDFGVRIQGDSMEPRIHDGGTVFVRAMPAIDSGKIGVFVLDGKVYCKKLVIDHDSGQVLLVSLNKDYDDILVGEFTSFRTLGRVVGQWTPGQNNSDIFGW